VLFEKLRQNISSRYFEKLISDHLLNNNHKSLVILKPKAGLNGINEMKLKESLSAYKDTLSGDELRTIVEETKNLKLYQETPSTQEEIDSIPMLTRDDIGSDPQPLYNEEMNVDGTRVIHHDVFTNEIVYLRLLFDVKDVPKELIPYLSLLSLVVGNVDTDNYSYLEYSNEVNLYTGGIDHNVISFSVKSNTGDYLPMYEIRTKVMYDKLPEAYRLIEEVINHTQIKDYKRLKEIIDEMKSRLQMIFLSSTHSIAVTRAMSYYSKHGMFKEATQGISFYQFLENISTNYGELKDEIISKLKTLMELIFTKDKLLVSVTADKRGYEMCMKSYSSFIQVIRKSASERLLAGYDRMPLAPKCLNEGFKAAMQVQYVARAGNYFKAGYEYTGALKVLRTILSYDYLWHNVRVKGGAYGCMCGFSGVDGDVYFTSYRDPGLRSTNETYENIPEFIKHYVANDRDITKSIISTISTLDIPLTPQTVGARSLSMFLAGITYEDLKREREEIINVTQEDIRALHGLIRSVLNEGNICVIGNENKIEEDRDLFKEVKNLM
jgi:Zn-dependent M16 (insulinase) family peptidase